MICNKCKSLVIIKYKAFDKIFNLSRCKHERLDLFEPFECSHFEEKPKDHSKQRVKAKELVSEGKPPRWWLERK